MVFLYYISTHLLKINRVSGIKAFFNFIRNLALLSLLFFRTKNSFITELILKIYTLNLLIVVKIDILDFALGIYLV